MRSVLVFIFSGSIVLTFANAAVPHGVAWAKLGDCSEH